MISRARKNALASYFNTAVNALVGLLVNPLLLNSLGPTSFGAWKSAQRLVDIGGAADGGAMQALKWVIAYKTTRDDAAEKRRDVGAALLLLAIWTPVLLAVSAIVVLLLPVLIAGVPESQTPVLLLTGTLLAGNVVATSYASLPDSVLIGTNQGYRSMLITTACLIATNLAMVTVAIVGFGIGALAVTTLAGTIVNGLLTLRAARHHVHWFGIRRPPRQTVAELTRFSGWVFVWALVNRLILGSEIVMLGALTSASIVASYTFTSYVPQFALAICLLTTSALMPKLGSAVGAKELDAASNIARDARELNLFLGTGFFVGIVLLNSYFVSIWTGPEQYLGDVSNSLMAVGVLQFSIFRNDAQIQDTGLKVERKVIIGAISTVVSLLLSAYFFKIFGSIAAIFVGLIAGRAIASIAFPLLANRVSGRNSWPIRSLIPAVGIAVATLLFLPLLHSAGLAASIGGALIGLGLSYFLVLSRATRVKIFNTQRSSRRLVSDE